MQSGASHYNHEKLISLYSAIWFCTFSCFRTVKNQCSLSHLLYYETRTRNFFSYKRQKIGELAYCATNTQKKNLPPLFLFICAWHFVDDAPPVPTTKVKSYFFKFWQFIDIRILWRNILCMKTSYDQGKRYISPAH